VYFCAAIKCFNFLLPKHLFLVLVISCLIHAALLQMLSLLFIGKRGVSLAPRWEGWKIKLHHSVMRLVTPASGKTQVLWPVLQGV